MAEEIDEIIGEFVVECREILDELDTELVSLEQNPDPDLLARIFRATHTIKGTSGFLGFTTLEKVTHVGENLLTKLRDGEMEVRPDIVSALLAMFDAVRDIIDRVERTGAEGDVAYPDLIARLVALDQGEQPAPATVDTGAEHADAAHDDEHADEDDGHHDDESGAPIEAYEQVETPASHQADEPSKPVPSAAPAATADTPAATTDNRPAAGESIRVDVELLDDLMNLVGELVLARNQIIQYTGTQSDSTFTATTQRLNLITTELQEGVMRTRMQPIENVWNKFPRVVRDLSVACGKQAQLVMEGKHTELDKTLLEAIKDPLTHLVRNSVDHGLELPDERVAAGKPAEGTVKLRAYHEGGQVIIEISDDGKGIDPAVIRRSAVAKGMMTAEEAAARSDREIVNVIFQPGFSTAATVTNISGRGVGMDVVRTNIESIGGSVDVQSEIGRGTTFKVKIPLTLAIIPALIVTCDSDRYAIPQVSLLELVRVDGDQAKSAIERVHGVPVYRLRGRLLPIVFLSEVFGQAPNDGAEGVNIVVLRADDREFGLVVDEINDTAEIVVKPLDRVLKQVSAFAGATIMGDGRVALILDVLGIADQIGMAVTRELRAANEAEAEQETDDSRADARRLLMLRVGARRLALPLDMVARLEEFDESQIETTATGRVVQYRGEILNLVFLADEIGVMSERDPGAPIQVVVYSEHGRSVGVAVDDIFDIVEEAIEIRTETLARGTLGSAVIHGQVTDVLDIAGLLRSAVPGFFELEAAYA